MLPTIEYPKTEIALVSTGKKVYLRPMTIREEKILLLAGETQDRRDILRAIVQILEACVEGPVKVKDLPSYDIEWLFVKLRAQSVSNIVKMAYTPEEGEKQYPFEIDLDKIEMTKPEGKVSATVEINKNVKIKLRHPSISVLLDDNEDPVTANAAGAIESISDGDNVTEAKIVPVKDLRKWVDGLSSGNLEKINEYVNNVPSLVFEKEIVLDDGSKEQVRLSSIFDFFSL